MQFQEEEDYTKRFDMQLWKRVLRLAKPYRWHLALILVCMTVCAGIDVLFPQLTRSVIDNCVTAGDTSGIVRYVLMYAGLVLTQGLAVMTFIRIAGKVEVGVTYDIRREGFKKLQELSFTYFDKTPVGFIMARMTSDAQRLGDTVGWVLIDLFWGTAYIIFAAIFMFRTDWRLALVVFSVIPPLAVISVFFQKIILNSYRIVRKTNSRITGSFNEGIMGARTSKTLTREKRNFEEFSELTTTMRTSSVRAANFSALFFPVVSTLGAVGAALALTRGGGNMLAGAMTVGTLIAFMQYAMDLFNPIREISRIFADLQSSQAAAERTMALLATEPDIVDVEAVQKKYGDNFAPKKENWEPIHGDVKFNNVSFKYKGGEEVLTDFNLDIKAGQTVALVGETGSGKSTIVNLVCGFYTPTSGEVLIDGQDIRTRSQLWLQSSLGYVLQQPHLFSGTIRENIRYGRLDATDQEVEDAARMVNAEEFISKLEKGYDTDVGEGGGRLSTGEKQLVSFARALIANPRIFVLDEATSSVDTETEQIIQHAIEKTLEGRTSFIIAHRLSTVRSADRILVLSKGRVIEDGSHRDLIRKKGHYYTLYTNQFLEEREAVALRAQAT